MTVHFESIDKSNEVESTSLTFSRPVRTGFYPDAGKRIFDLALIMIALPIVLPVMIVLSAMLVANGQQPFFRQKRVGRDGHEFTIWKFRTMVVDADERLQQYLDQNEAAMAEWRDHQKLRNDPRVTAVGRALRKTSLDELPQLWNVIKGEMSLVGPRPMMPHQRRLYPGSAYYAMLPGITGAWQVSARNESEFKTRAQYDTKYGQAVSLFTDVSLLFRTISVVFRGTGF